MQLMGDSVQVFIYAVDAWLNQGKRNNHAVLEERKDCMEKNVGSVYVQCINIFFLKLN